MAVDFSEKAKRFQAIDEIIARSLTIFPRLLTKK